MSYVDRSQPRERDDILPLAQPRVRDRLAHATVMELGVIRSTLNAANVALAALDRADEANDPKAFVDAAKLIRESGDLWARAKRFARLVEGKLR